MARFRDCCHHHRTLTRVTRARRPNTPLQIAVWALEELPRDVEAEIPVLAAGAAAGELAHRGAEAIGEIQLEDVPAGALLDAERAVIDAGLVANPREELTHEIHRWPDPKSCAEPENEGVVIVGQFARQWVGVVHPHRLDVDRAVATQLT